MAENFEGTAMGRFRISDRVVLDGEFKKRLVQQSTEKQIEFWAEVGRQLAASKTPLFEFERKENIEVDPPEDCGNVVACEGCAGEE